LSGRGLCDELITRPEESYRLWCVVVCDLETSRMGAPYIYDISYLRVNYKSGQVIINSVAEAPSKICKKTTTSFVTSVRYSVGPSRQNSSTPAEGIFVKFGAVSFC